MGAALAAVAVIGAVLGAVAIRVSAAGAQPRPALLYLRHEA